MNQFRGILLDLRDDMLRRYTLLTAAFILCLMNVVLLVRPFPADMFVLLSVLLVATLLLRDYHEWYAARYTFIAVLHIGLMIGMYLKPDALLLPILGVPLVFMSALLMSNMSMPSAAILYGWILLLSVFKVADYPLAGLLMLYFGVMIVSHTAIATLYTALSWYSSMHQRADKLLDETRERRAELVLALKSLEAAYQTQRRMQHQLVFARQQATEARRMKERFAANISHELRTPLNLIMGFSEIMYLTPEVYGNVIFPPKLVRDIHQIYTNSRHLLDMIDDVLDLSHLELSGFSLHFQQTNLNEFLAQTTDMLRNLFRGQHLELRVEVEPNLPMLEIDRTRVRQILLNLFNNAQRFTETGSVTLRVSRNTHDVIFQVIDTGKGIPADKLPFIFDEFFQVDYSLSRQHGGAGLGLSITKRFVEAHNGVISVQSEEGDGSTFTFTLPLPISNRSMTQTQEIAMQMDKDVVLVVDRDPLIVSMIRRHLDQFDVVQVDSTEGLDDAIHQYYPRAVINNVQPQSTMQIINYSMPYIECSLPSSMWFAQQLGVAASLAKPITTQQIHEQIERFAPLNSILIVDDDLGFVQLVQRSIETMADTFTIYRAYDGVQALELVEAHHPQLVFLDLAMPEMNGFEVIDRIHELQPDLPVVLLTATRYIQSDQESHSAMLIHQTNGLNPSEVLRCLRSIVETLHPK